MRMRERREGNGREREEREKQVVSGEGVPRPLVPRPFWHYATTLKYRVTRLLRDKDN